MRKTWITGGIARTHPVAGAHGQLPRSARFLYGRQFLIRQLDSHHCCVIRTNIQSIVEDNGDKDILLGSQGVSVGRDGTAVCVARDASTRPAISGFAVAVAHGRRHFLVYLDINEEWRDHPQSH